MWYAAAVGACDAVITDTTGRRRRRVVRPPTFDRARLITILRTPVAVCVARVFAARAKNEKIIDMRRTILCAVIYSRFLATPRWRHAVVCLSIRRNYCAIINSARRCVKYRVIDVQLRGNDACTEDANNSRNWNIRFLSLSLIAMLIVNR